MTAPSTPFRQSTIDRLSTPEDLDELMHITTPRRWLALAALGALLLTAIVWSILTTIPTTVSAAGALAGTSHALQAIVAVPADKAVQVRPGMDVKITVPTTSALQPLSFGGKVTSVDAVPADQQTLIRLLGSASYARALAAGGEFVPVHLALTHRMGVVGGALKRGMVLHADITVSNQRVIQLVIP